MQTKQTKKIVQLDRKIAVRIPQTLFDKLTALENNSQVAALIRRLLSVGFEIESRRRAQR